jgi:UDP:flavonoid glycosyltransferase YjiC (YdhE family)
LRVVVASIPETSHVFPLVPMARALQDAGHDVLAVAQPNVAPALAAAGLPVTVTGKAFDSVNFFQARLPAGMMPAEAWPFDLDLMMAMAARTWSSWARGLLSQQLDTVADWRPDLVLSEPMELATRIAAGVLGVPVVEHRWGPDSTMRFRPEAARRMAPLARRHGLTGLPRPALVLDPCPPALRRPDAEPGRPVRFIPYNGAGTHHDGRSTGPDPTGEPGAAPRVCVCFGRVVGTLTEGRLLRWTLEALGAIDGIDVMLAVAGPEADALGPVAGNVRVLRDVPLSTFLAQCDAIVHHGGDGTGMTALSCGVPQVVIPQLALQDNFGQLVEQAGAGRNLRDPGAQRNPAIIAAAVRAVLEQPGYRNRAAALRAEVEAMPPPASVVPDLERLAVAALS